MYVRMHPFMFVFVFISLCACTHFFFQIVKLLARVGISYILNVPDPLGFLNFGSRAISYSRRQGLVRHIKTLWNQTIRTQNIVKSNNQKSECNENKQSKSEHSGIIQFEIRTQRNQTICFVLCSDRFQTLIYYSKVSYSKTYIHTHIHTDSSGTLHTTRNCKKPIIYVL